MDPVDDLGVRERGHVAERTTAGHVAEQSAHDLARACLRKIAREDDAVWARDLPDHLRHVVTQLLGHGVVSLELRLQGNERNDRLADKVDPAKVEIGTDIRGTPYIFTLDTDQKEKRGKNMMTMGRRKDWKKAYVKLAEGSRLDII